MRTHGDTLQISVPGFFWCVWFSQKNTRRDQNPEETRRDQKRPEKNTAESLQSAFPAFPAPIPILTKRRSYDLDRCPSFPISALEFRRKEKTHPSFKSKVKY